MSPSRACIIAAVVLTAIAVAAYVYGEVTLSRPESTLARGGAVLLMGLALAALLARVLRRAGRR